MRLRALVFVAFFSSALSEATVGQPSTTGAMSRFDGEWQVTMTCPNNTERSAARSVSFRLR